MANINKRLEQLEQRAQADMGLQVLYLQDDGCYSTSSGLRGEPGRIYTPQEKDALAREGYTIIVVQYASDWRATNEQPNQTA